MDYTVDTEKFQMAMEGIGETSELFGEALSKGWVPDFQKAIDEWHTACLDLEIGEGYVEHILEEHPEDDIIFRMENVFETQANEFLAELEENDPDEAQTEEQKITGAKAQVKKLLEGFEPYVQIQILQRLLNETQK